MRWRLRNRSIRALVVECGVLGLLVLPATSTHADEAALDYQPRISAPARFPACNESWFRSRFELTRGRERFSSPTTVDVAVMEDGNSGFVLDLFLRSSANGLPIDSTRRDYHAPIECSRVLADAAEITLEMMRKHSTNPLQIQKSRAYDVEISAPDALAACRDKDEWRKFFELYRGHEQFPGPFPNTVELSFERNAEKRIVVKAVLRNAQGRPLVDRQHQRLDDIRLGPYAEHAECTHALAYSAQSVVNLLEGLPRPWPIIPPRENEPRPVPTGPVEFGSGFTIQEGFLSNNLQMGFQMLFKLPIFQHNSLVWKSAIMGPHNWRRDDGVELGSINLFANSALAFCTNRPYWGICPEVRVSRVEVDLSSIQSKLRAGFWLLTIGPNAFLETKPFIGGLRFRADGSLGGNLSLQGFKTGPRTLLEPSPLAWTAQLSFTVPLVNPGGSR